ncbi:MAG TPA: class A beta-lactamase-related serine hydrolase [Candidatus Paceibacterota bacterium]|nr:class A beta-lactamase-related serine hydrolase [Candidatus Pacearchaeota archaeon]HRZ50449.1 class A beta-lactamase-related serine hydrolase [Candidatus Paceibacterota bacterium]HSA36170.1 class A beta-lactamase-related serine hydrolase [Candidatus Paceibacterota bacterium]
MNFLSDTIKPAVNKSYLRAKTLVFRLRSRFCYFNRPAFYLAAAVIIFLSGYCCGGKKIADSYDTGQIREGGYEYINPLLECDVAKESIPKYISFEEETKKQINKIKNDHPNVTIAVYFRNLNNGPWFGINENENFIPASLLKVPVMMAYLKQTETDPLILEKRLTVIKDDNFNYKQRVVPTSQVEIGKSYPVAELLHYSIAYSDNLATITLINGLPSEKINKVYSDLGLPLPTASYETDAVISTKNYASFFRILYNASYLNEQMSEYALKLLTEVDFRNGIVAKIPPDIKVAHKFGERNFENLTQIHDCGIVYAPHYPYLICVMTRGSNMDENEELIAETSRIVFNKVFENRENFKRE